MRSMRLKLLPIVGLLLALTAFSVLDGCASVPLARPETTAAPSLPLPAATKPVKWQDRPDLGGLFLTYDEYRKLETNIIEYRREIAELRALAAYYGSGD